MRRTILSGLIVLSVFAGVLGAAPAAGSARLSPADETRVRAVMRDYEKAWLSNDEDRVMRLFTEDAVLLPHHGVEPQVGKSAARAFWFPRSGPPTVVTELIHQIDEIGGSGDLAYLRGHARVAWTTGRGRQEIGERRDATGSPAPTAGFASRGAVRNRARS